MEKCKENRTNQLKNPWKSAILVNNRRRVAVLERKIYQKIEDFYANVPHKALMITGARQVGKSYIIEEYGRAHFENFIKLDFIEHPEYIDAFRGAKNHEDLLLRLSTVFGSQLVPGKTMIFFDEVQECKEIITQIKYLVLEGSYSYILSGSLLGTIFKEIRSVPVGYMEVVQMYPMDFEEFARANGVGDKVFKVLEKSFIEKTPVDSFIHERLLSLFELYLIVGGMPAAVSAYLKTKNLSIVAQTQTSIIELYKRDISKYDREDKLYINEIFDLIPSELNAKNKRFILKNMNENARFSKYNNSFLWLKNAGVALPVFVVDEPKAPLLLSKSSNLFKLFSNDVGLLAAQYGAGIQLRILNHETSMNFGSVYENVAAQEFAAHGYHLYYYNSKKFGELDFVLEDGGRIIPIEIKSGKDYYRHNAMDNVLNCKEYDIPEGYVFCTGNVEVQDRVAYYPVYMLMFLRKEEPSEQIIYDSNFSDLNEMVN